MALPVVDAVDPPAAEPEVPPGCLSPRGRVGVLALTVLLAVLGLFQELRPGGRPASPKGSWTLTPYEGLGAWVDVYDWTEALGGPTPAVGPNQIDEMADAGVQTVFLQTARASSADDVTELDRLNALIDRAHARHLHVVAWYLPTYVDLAVDERHLEAAADLKVDGLSVDIEGTDVVDVAERNRRVVELSDRLRSHVGRGKALSATTLSPTHLEVVNPEYWPGYPWPHLAETYDAILPMAYWTIRVGDLRDGERYITDTVERIKIDTFRPDIPIHVIGGIADKATLPDLQGMIASIRKAGAIGGSLYDWTTANPAQWKALQPLRALR